MTIPAGRNRILNALERVNATLPCPRCGNGRFSLLDGYVIEHPQRHTRNLVISGDNRVASVVMACDRCGFMAQHALSVLDRD
jgi:ribosomal protein S27AE